MACLCPMSDMGHRHSSDSLGHISDTLSFVSTIRKHNSIQTRVQHIYCIYMTKSMRWPLFGHMPTYDYQPYQNYTYHYDLQNWKLVLLTTNDITFNKSMLRISWTSLTGSCLIFEGLLSPLSTFLQDLLCPIC